MSLIQSLQNKLVRGESSPLIHMFS